MAYLFCFCYVQRNVGNPLMELRILYITIINTSNYPCYYCCWYALSLRKYLLPCNFIERDIPWNQLFLQQRAFFLFKIHQRLIKMVLTPHIALIRINDTTKNQKDILYYATKMEQRENDVINLLIVGVCNNKIHNELPCR